MSSPRFSTGNKGARWILSVPLLVFLAILVVYPIITGVQTALLDRTLLNPEPGFVGLDNFARVLGDGGFWIALRFTVIYTVVVTAIELVLGFLLALVFDRAFPGKKWLLSVIILPVMIAPALMGIMFRLILNQDIGLVPAIFSSLGQSVSLFSSDSIIPVLVILDLLQWTPFTFLLFYSALQSVPEELYEAASLDRARYARVITSIVIPLLMPTIFIAGFLRAIDAFRTFDTVYVLTGGGPGNSTTTLSIYIYKILSGGDFGTASAAAAIVAIVMLPLVPIVVRRLNGDVVAKKK
ncbi:sugar ABC transporter permease [Cryobacterium sp. TMT1-2-2]|nr:sugar ABC transporter permease [Cryobacterium sp. TMT1-66-1]TFD07898.1 sugar ABC transporter permease [Cryobacterium sp. TMT1-2-2]